jgi:AcrR family transcriptional regulator
MDAALACFARKGYHNTTMDDIVAESGLSKGTLYWYFKSKDDLFLSLVKSFFLDMRQDFENILEQPTTPSGKLRAMAQGFVQFFQET